MGLNWNSLSKGTDYELVPQDESPNSNDLRDSFLGQNQKRNRTLLAVTGVLILSLALNTILTIFVARPELKPGFKPSFTQIGSHYAGLERNTPVPIERSTPYSGNDLMEVRRLWEDISIDDGMLALPDDFVKEKDLPEAQRFPWDDGKGIYFLNGYHNLHCLRSVHIALMEFHLHEPQTRRFEHVMHCMDSLRQDIYCNADDTPRYTTSTKEPESGIGQTRMCRDWSKLERWAQSYNACYRFVNQTATGFPNVFRYTYCPEGSPYIEKIEETFGPPENGDTDHKSNM